MTTTKPLNPECRAGKHANCDGQAWDFNLDVETLCACDCHMGDNPCGPGLSEEKIAELREYYDTTSTVEELGRAVRVDPDEDERSVGDS